MTSVEFGDPGNLLAVDLATVYRAHVSSARLLAYRIIRDRDLAADAVQEAFLSLWLLRQAYRPELGEVRGLLHTLVRRRAVDLLRSRGSGPTTYSLDRSEADQVIDLEPGPEECALLADQAEQVSAAVDALAPDKREVLLLGYLQGHSQSHIAALLGIPLGTVKTRVQGAKRDLRLLIGPLQS